MKKAKSFLAWIRKKRSRSVLAILILILVTVFFVTRGNGVEEPQLQTATVERGTIISSITASGQILTSNIAHVTSQASGVVKKVYVFDGNNVTVGQTIAEIELDSEGAQNQASAYASYVSAANSLKNSENNYRSARATLDRVYDEIQGHDEDETLEMRETRTTAEVAHDNAYNAIETARASLNSAWLKYSETRAILTAPASGTINSVTIAEGLTLGATEGAGGGRTSQRVASIVSEGTPLSSFNISEIDVSQIETGQKVIINIDAISDKTFTGKVVSVDRIGTVTQGVVNYSVLISLDTSDKELLPNMNATAEIILSSKPNVLIVPVSAISQFQGNAIINVLINGQPQEKEVEIGLQTPTQIEIISGLDEGEIVITGQRQTGGEGGSQFGGQSRGGFGGGALRPGGFSGGFRGGGSDDH